MALSTPGALSLSSPLNLSTAGNAVVVPIAPTKRLALSVNNLTGSGATLAIDGSRDGGNTWATTGMTGVDYDTGAAVAALVDDADYRVITRGYTHLQIRVATAGTGATLLLLVSQARAQDVFAANPSVAGGAGGTVAASQAGQWFESPFQPIPGATTGLTVGPAATAAPVALPQVTAASYRIRNASTSASPAAWRLNTANSGANNIAAVMPVAASTAGTGGTVGDKSIDPGGVEVFTLTAAQQAALAAGTLYLSAVTLAGGSATIYVTPGVAGR